ncbi:MAG TPA: mannose-1-phosphate guanylyltransferase [Verrucomicrobia bacterium]|nr:mannose-1-phosphate guanylyltransferase [Verrucomicrobiota bacterium]HOB31518.1 sugar phosphate nucleotidyltransferase [Verrucomicrobiota bacterium]HOP98837.1 sugar phosphate nucleotidyltransferase [Verrucomicrobiota bacterium]HPU57520.1 sugar phosphate nucleotidyltransferase [Verrucomicrobiota bacterium]
MKPKTDSKDRFVVIMAGGRGERFWPLSREKTPKQLLRLLGNRSFLQQAVDRVLPLVPIKNVLIITNQAQAPEVRKQLPKLPKNNIIAEPIGRDTCAAVTLGAALVGARSTTAVMAVLPADHVIPEEKKFQQVLGDAFDLAGRGQALITIGIQPTEPATGYGYIRVGDRLPPPTGAKPYKTAFHRAEQFVEKPHFEKALEYVNSGQYRWNAGMFIWSFVAITEGLQKHQPEMYEACQRWFKVAGNPARLNRVLAKEYPSIKRISIDYALMEHAQNVVVADGAFEWDDLGAWNALARHLKADPEGNCAVGQFVHVDAARNVIFDARTKNRTPIAVVGLRDSILVQTDDAVLLAHKSQAQKVKELVKRLAADPKLRKLV